MTSSELGEFLRHRRAAVTPEAVGLPLRSGRRTPGLRREEVAELAFVSTEYYRRLEQGRAPRPTHDVLASLARVLGLTAEESAFLHELAQQPVPRPTAPAREVRPMVADVLHMIRGTAGFVVSCDLDVLAWNPLAALLLEDFGARAPDDRNLAREAFCPRDAARPLYGASDREEFQRHVVHQLRLAAARYPADQRAAALIGELRDVSPEFAELWERWDVASEVAVTKAFDHPTAGRVVVDCEVLDIARGDQSLVLYRPADDASRRALDLLAER